MYNNAADSTKINNSLPLEVTIPAANNSLPVPVAEKNTKMAIDVTVNRYRPFIGATGYGVRVVNGIQYFVSPNRPDALINVGDLLIIITDSGDTLNFSVVDLDLFVVPYTPPSIICFLGSAPVLTPSGYRRIDSLAVGDIVNTPKGTAAIEAIKTQVCEPSKYSNPYVIPERVFGATSKLLISPNHRISVSGHMFEARKLGLEQEEQKNTFTYYNIQITKAQNMIVAGVEVESLQPLVRSTISRENFNYILATQHGGKMTSEIRAKCHFLADGTVSVPSIKR
jgi:hypothetical protein